MIYNKLRIILENEFPLKPFSIKNMREYTLKEMDWEYNREYEKYAKPFFPNAFDSREHYQKKYDASPLRHLSKDEFMNLDYCTAPGVIHHQGDKMSYVKNEIGDRRNVDEIHKNIISGKTAPPIVLKHSKGIRLMAGNTRLLTGAAIGYNIPVKVIDISDRH